jgi:hypothetical protein
MSSFSLRKWAAVLGNALQELKFMPHRARLERAADLQELAGLLFHIERQTKQARIKYLRQAMTKGQLQAFWRHKLEEIQHLLREAALPSRLPRSLLAERVLRALEDWQHGTHAACQRSLQSTDLRNLERRLEDLADALVAYAIAEREQWCDTQPSL